MTAPITRLNPPTLPDAGAMGYSQISVVEPGARMAYVSGQVAWRPGGEAPPADLVEQTRIAAANARAALDALGATPHDIVMARCFVTDLTPERLHAVFPPLLELFDGAKPCITGVGVAALAGPDLQVELELTVRLPS
ncbi:RidA family protein [Anaeromyxobacter sp. PSR-1]|uniref:RidA family protein n=1 Tax=unclassified Anaeromyxobacter TaxID=2620896 RepID=UPI0005E4404A|nr:RidA family protein [Anaeromyxobacter sp. PSR-1]GAO01657.1 2-iminobutanoate/2-iminopropanoate deaminase [Anaeromyxobacter sp. PSR-1]